VGEQRNRQILMDEDIRLRWGRITSDGGVMLLVQRKWRLGIAERLAAVIPDGRDASRVVHPLADVLGACVFAIAHGYEDADDLDPLRLDPAFKPACGRLRLQGGCRGSDGSNSR
jgi:hypothetical protein